MSTTLTPFTGIKPGTKLRWSHRGDAHTGKVHATTSDLTVIDGRLPASTRTLCGRTVRPLCVWSPTAWGTMVNEHERIGLTHEINTCSRCVKLTDVLPADTQCKHCTNPATKILTSGRESMAMCDDCSPDQASS